MYIGNSAITQYYVGGTLVDRIYQGDTIVYEREEPTPSGYSEQYLTFEILSAGTIKWFAMPAATPLTIQYKKNGGVWTSITSSTGGTDINVEAGDILKFKGTNAAYTTSSGSNYFNGFRLSTAPFNAYGNIMSLIAGDDFINASAFTSDYVFRSLFTEASIQDASNLVMPVVTLTEGCYMGMFQSSQITNAPVLPATTMAKNCYWNMFLGTHIATPPALPATTLAENCYRAMFYNCGELTSAPDLPATTLAVACYYQMMQQCSGITTAPELPATTLMENCYRAMFNLCSSLNYIKCLATDISASGCTYSWTNGVSGSGTFVKSSAMTGWSVSSSGIPTNWVVEDYPPVPVDYSTQYLTFEVLSGGTITWGNEDYDYRKVMAYTRNSADTNWALISSLPRRSINVNAGEKIYFRATNTKYLDNSHYNQFGGTAIVNIYGNIMSIIAGSAFTNYTTLDSAETYTFANIFGPTKVLDASNLILPSNTIAHCYEEMFAGNTTLVAAPVLPAVTPVNTAYRYMFMDCTSLSSITCLATVISDNVTMDWTNNVSPTGIFTKASGATGWSIGSNGIPSGWTVQDYNPNPQPSSNPVLVVYIDNQGGLFSTDQSGYYDSNEDLYCLPPTSSNNGVYTWSFSANPEEGLTIAFLFADSAHYYDSTVTASTFTNTQVYLDASDSEVYSDVKQSETNYGIYVVQVDTPSWALNNENTDLVGGYYGVTVVYDTTDESVEITWSGKEYWQMGNESDCMDLGGCWDEGEEGCFRCAEGEPEE